jgi:transposase
MHSLVENPLIAQKTHLKCLQQINSFKAFHRRALERIIELDQKHKSDLTIQKHNFDLERDFLLNQISLLKGQNRDLNKRLYGKKTEGQKGVAGLEPLQKSSKKRGQQLGSKGHGRTLRPEKLKVKDEVLEIPEKERTCSTCHLVYPEFGKPEVSELLEIEVHAYKRSISRPKFKTCDCNGHSKIITALPANRLFPKTIYGVSIWHKFIINKYILSMPTERTCKELKPFLGKIASGTIDGGYKIISPFFDPLLKAFHDKQMQEDYFHCDETYWKVFEKLLDKANYQWYMWGLFSKSVRYYHFSPNRSTQSLQNIFSGLNETLKEITIVSDRYAAYKCYAKNELKVLVILAFCWAHVRRDFLNAANSYPELAVWMYLWVENIRDIYAINKKRLKCCSANLPLSEQNEEFHNQHKALNEKLLAMKEEMKSELSKSSLHEAQRNVLKSLQEHWVGLTYFYERPYIHLDNNLAEREVRICVLGRKNFYGSGSIWSAEFSGKIYSFVKTYELWGLDASKGIFHYLLACSENGGKAPKDINDFIPWEMSEERKIFFKEPMHSITSKIISA